MIANLPPYSVYRPSGVNWLGDVPAHWEVRRTKQVFERIVGGSTPLSSEPSYWDGDVVWVTPTDISEESRLKDSLRRITKSGLDNCSTEMVPAGSIVISCRAPVGNVALAQVPLCTNQGCKALIPEKQVIISEYAFQLFRILQEELQSWANGTTFTEISTTSLGKVLVPLPPLPEQDTIVRYLDHVGRRIERYIEAKEQLIARLQEARQSIIQRAVTRGLDPDVPLKPSGVEWLGDVPAHWEVRRLRTLGEAIIGLTYSPQDVVDEDEGTLVLRASNISEGRIVYGDNVYVRCSVPDRLVVQVGDILICSRSGSRGLIGKNARIDSALSGSTFGAFMTIFRSEHNDYLHCIFNSKLFEYQSGAFLTSTINQLTLGILNNFKIPWPPLAEQKEIAAYVDKTTAGIDAAIDNARRQVEFMTEYRASLIAHVVTGKLDVRAAAEHLPQESRELAVS